MGARTEQDATSSSPVTTRRPLLARLMSLGGGGATVVAAAAAALLFAVLLGPRFLPYQTYSVLSGSMEPELDVGAMIVLRPVAAEDIQVGDIITFSRPDRPSQMVTHRVARIDDGTTGRFLVTKGDANGKVDDWRVPAAGDGWRYAFDVPHLGRALAALHGIPARVALVVLPAAVLGLLTLIALWRPRGESPAATPSSAAAL